MSHKVIVIADPDNDTLTMPCGKENRGFEKKRKMFANMHKKRCDICGKISKIDFKLLYELNGNLTDKRVQTIKSELINYSVNVQDKVIIL